MAERNTNTHALEITTPMAPPAWALMERELLRAQERACVDFFARYVDERGYLKMLPRWGGNDGPDDAIENFTGWPTLHALGASDEMLRMYKLAWEGHILQYTEAKTTEVPFARDGMYYKEFSVMFDFFHHGEGLAPFNLQGLSDPRDGDFGKRVRRFAGFYMNEDPQAPNYDPEHKIIRSMFTGSRGPLLRKATALDWAGDPIEVAGRFKAQHGERDYEEMLAHFKDYTDIVGDHPINLAATTLALNAYALTGEAKYRDWLLEYVDAWSERARANNDIIPSNIGLDGTIGGETDGKWYGGCYGWGFTVVVPQTGALADRCSIVRAIAGFGNALLVTGDRGYIGVWRRMLDAINANRKTVDGQVMYPSMHGDQGWYSFKPQPWSQGALDVWYWSMDPEDRRRLPPGGWAGFLEGENPEYPVQALQREFESVRRKAAGMRADTTTWDTRLSDDTLRFNPAAVGTLIELMLGGINPRFGEPLHCRVRYFDPARRRAGIPEDVAALVEKLSDDAMTLTLVNINAVEDREVVVQAGAYAEHQFAQATAGEETLAMDRSAFTVRLAPGAGSRIEIRMKRYANRPTLAFPWDRGQ